MNILFIELLSAKEFKYILVAMLFQFYAKFCPKDSAFQNRGAKCGKGMKGGNVNEGKVIGAKCIGGKRGYMKFESAGT